MVKVNFGINHTNVMPINGPASFCSSRIFGERPAADGPTSNLCLAKYKMLKLNSIALVTHYNKIVNLEHGREYINGNKWSF